MTNAELSDSPRGRPFKKGKSGNPSGRPLGARNLATLAAEALLDGEAEALARKAVDLALEGDAVALRMCLDRVLPVRRERRLKVPVPPLNSAADGMRAVTAIVAATASGEITLSEAAELSRLVELFIKALEAHDFDQRLKMLEEDRSTLVKEKLNAMSIAASIGDTGEVSLRKYKGRADATIRN